MSWEGQLSIEIREGGDGGEGLGSSDEHGRDRR